MDVYGVARIALDVALEVLPSRPDRAFVSPRRPAHEFGCDQLASWVQNIVLTSNFPDPARRPVDQGPLRPMVTLALELARCTPTVKDGGKPADTGALQEAARTLLTDAWNIHRALLDSALSGDLRGQCGSVALLGVEFPGGTETAHSALIRVAVADWV